MAASLTKATLVLVSAAWIVAGSAAFAQNASPGASNPPRADVTDPAKDGGQNAGSGGQTGTVTAAPKRGLDPKCTAILADQVKYTKAEVEECGKKSE